MSFFDLDNVDIVIIPCGCTSKVQPLHVCLNKPFKTALWKKWVEYMDSLVSESDPLKKLTPPAKPAIVQ